VWETLHRIQQDGLLVDLRRESLDSLTLRCFVTALSADFAVLSRVNDNCEFDGVIVIRTEDVTFARWDSEVLRSWGTVLQESPSSPEPAGFVDLASWESVVRTIHDNVPVVTFQRERADGDICHVGTGITILAEGIEADEVSIEGTIDGKFAINLEDLTRVDFGGGYERALWRMVQKTRA
jgi:hypothetical protein